MQLGGLDDSVTVFGVPPLRFSHAAHLLVFEEGAHLLRPLVLLFGHDALPLLGHGKLDHLHVAIQQSLNGGQLSLAAQGRSLLLRLRQLLRLILAETLNLAILPLTDTILTDKRM